MALGAVFGASTARMQVIVSAAGVEETQRKLAAITGQVKGAERVGGSVGVGAVASATAAIAVIGKIGYESVRAYSSFQRFETSMKALAGESTGGRLAKDMQNFAMHSAYGAAEVRRMSQLLLATGTPADKLVERMRMIANLTAASGGDSGVFGRVALAIGQIQAAGVLRGQELRQLTEAGVSMPQLAKELGITPGQLQNSQATIGSDRVIAALERIVGSRGDLQASLAQSNPEVRMQNMMDSLQNAIIPVGEQFYRLLGPLFTFTEWTLRQINAVIEFTHGAGVVQIALVVLAGGVRSLVIAAIEMKIALHAAAQAAIANAGANVAAASGSKVAGGIGAALGMGKIGAAGGPAVLGGPVGWTIAAGLVAWGIYDIISSANQPAQPTAALEPRSRSDIENMQSNVSASMSY